MIDVIRRGGSQGYEVIDHLIGQLTVETQTGLAPMYYAPVLDATRDAPQVVVRVSGQMTVREEEQGKPRHVYGLTFRPPSTIPHPLAEVTTKITIDGGQVAGVSGAVPARQNASDVVFEGGPSSDTVRLAVVPVGDTGAHVGRFIAGEQPSGTQGSSQNHVIGFVGDGLALTAPWLVVLAITRRVPYPPSRAKLRHLAAVSLAVVASVYTYYVLDKPLSLNSNSWVLMLVVIVVIVPVYAVVEFRLADRREPWRWRTRALSHAEEAWC